jgi:hypothetical protein
LRSQMTLTTQDALLLASLAGGVFGAVSLVVRAISRSSCKEFVCCYGMIRCFRDTGSVGPRIDTDTDTDTENSVTPRERSKSIVMEIPTIHRVTSRRGFRSIHPTDDNTDDTTL